MGEPAEHYAMPAYKWIGPERRVRNINGHELSNYPGGVGFRVKNYHHDKHLVITFHIYREDGCCEDYIMRARHVSHWEYDIEKWQTHQAVLFPYEGPHGQIEYITFSYLLHKEGELLYSEYQYKFARREDFHWQHVEIDDFHEPFFKRHRTFPVREIEHRDLQNAQETLNREGRNFPLFAAFTRGDVSSPYHPDHEIHRMLDRVLESRDKEPWRRHYVHLAVFNFDNEHLANHLLHLHSRGVEVECIGGWEQVSPADWSDQVPRLRRAGIPVHGIVRNTPYDSRDGIASMHTKFIVFDGQYATSSSYNLDFHRWGGNWENGIFYHSWAISLLYEHIFQAIKGGIFRQYSIRPECWYNLHYSFGTCRDQSGRPVRAVDAILDEIRRACSSILITMFDLGDISADGSPSGSLIASIIEAHRRGVCVIVLLNGFRSEREDHPVSHDLSCRRPLKPVIEHLVASGIEVMLLYHHETPFSPLHHKFAVFDEHTVIAESFNWYPASLYSDEVFSVVRDSDLARSYIEEMHLMIRSFRIRQGWER